MDTAEVLVIIVYPVCRRLDTRDEVLLLFLPAAWWHVDGRLQQATAGSTMAFAKLAMDVLRGLAVVGAVVGGGWQSREEPRRCIVD